MSVLHQLKLSHKFLILGLLTLLMIALPTAMYVSYVLAETRSAHLEARGVAPLIALNKTVQQVQVHRGLSAGMLVGTKFWLPKGQRRGTVWLRWSVR